MPNKQFEMDHHQALAQNLVVMDAVMGVVMDAVMGVVMGVAMGVVMGVVMDAALGVVMDAVWYSLIQGIQSEL